MLVLFIIRRIIPAYAGSTIRSHTNCRAREDHPRVCGEHLDNANFSNTREGSSPRMRGALADALALVSVGIIPAYAGSTEGAGGMKTEE